MLWQQRSSSIGSGRWWQIMCQKGLTSGASINRRFYNTYADDYAEDITYNTINSFAISPQPLFLISDTWHLMTTSRNGFENSGANRIHSKTVVSYLQIIEHCNVCPVYECLSTFVMFQVACEQTTNQFTISLLRRNQKYLETTLSFWHNKTGQILSDL